MKPQLYIIITLFILSLNLKLIAQNDTSFLKKWTVGTEKTAVFNIGNVKSNTGCALGVFGEKHFLPWFGLRLQIGMGKFNGLDIIQNTGWKNHKGWNGNIDSTINYNNAAVDYIYSNYKTNFQETSLQGIFRFTRLPFINNNSPFDVFLSMGAGAVRYRTFIDAADVEGNIYDFSKVELFEGNTINEKKADLLSLLDGKYETSVEDPLITLQYQLGLGIEYQVNNNISVSLAHRVSILQTKDLDSYKWDNSNNPKNSFDLLNQTSLCIGITIGKKKSKDIPVPIIVDKISEEEEKEEPIISEEIRNEQDTVVSDITEEDENILIQAFENLEFESNKAIIKSVSFDALNKLADLLNNKTNLRLSIAGHTDNVGDAGANMTLSKNRAEAIRDYLVTKGIDINRFEVSWFGQTNPIADNNTIKGRQKNRRVELKIIRE